MKKILIIGAGFLQSFLIKRAKELGYYTIAIDKNQNSIGFKYADESDVIDIIDQKACLNFAKVKQVDGVVTVATDYGVMSAAYVAEKMNLQGIELEVARVIKNKYLVRKKLFENCIDDINQCFEVSSLEELKHYQESIDFPVMVKPVDGSGSKGASKAESLKELQIACTGAINASLIGKCLIEDYIEGKEYGVESFVYNNEIYILGIMDKLMTKPPKHAELGHVLPIKLKIEDKVKSIIKKAIRTLGVNFGSVNMDVLITDDKQVCIIDVGARMGGNLIGSHIIPLGTGIDYMGILIKSSLGETFDIKSQASEGYVATRLLALSSGKIEQLPNFSLIQDTYNVEVYHQLKIGDDIKEYRNNLDGCGYVVAQSPVLSYAIHNANAAVRRINNEIIRANQ